MPPGSHSDKSLHLPRDFPKKMPGLFLDSLAMLPSLPKEAGVAREGQDEWSHHMSSRLQSPEQSQEPESLPLVIQSARRDREVLGGQLLGGRVGLGSSAICPAASLPPGYSDHIPEPLRAGQRVLASPYPSPHGSPGSPPLTSAFSVLPRG